MNALSLRWLIKLQCAAALFIQHSKTLLLRAPRESRGAVEVEGKSVGIPSYNNTQAFPLRARHHHGAAITPRSGPVR